MLREKLVSQIFSFLGIESASCGAARRFFYLSCSPLDDIWSLAFFFFLFNSPNIIFNPTWVRPELHLTQCPFPGVVGNRCLRDVKTRYLHDDTSQEHCPILELSVVQVHLRIEIHHHRFTLN